MDALATATGFGLASLAHAVLAALMALTARRATRGLWLAFAAGFTALWALFHGVRVFDLLVGDGALLRLMETLRPLVWLLPLVLILRRDTSADEHADSPQKRLALGLAAGLATTAALALLLPATGLLVLLLMASLAGLVVVERIYRGGSSAQRWSLKHLCAGLGLLFAFDFYVFSTALLFGGTQPGLELGRAAVAAVAAPLVAVSAARTRSWSLNIGVSRRLVTDSIVLTTAGLYLLAMAGAGYYLRLVGGVWGPLLQAIFLAGAVGVLLLGVFSGTLRARLRVLVAKHFFSYRYDYREEWIRFMGTLSDANGEEPPRQRCLRALAQIVDSRSGVLFARRDDGAFELAAVLNQRLPETLSEPGGSALVRYLQDTAWVVDLDELAGAPERYRGLQRPAWLTAVENPWLILPLFDMDRLQGFAVLGRPLTARRLDWEDRDLLKTAGRQVAGYLALLQATDALVDARQFEAFNRLSAFLVHDLKNVSGQLALVSRNARRLRDNAEFVDDAFETMESARQRLDRVLAGLRKAEQGAEGVEAVSVATVLAAVAEACADRAPVPHLGHVSAELAVACPAGRFQTVLEHLVRNTQDATPTDGEVTLRAEREDQHCRIEIEDTGEGMSEAFIRDRLFRPFQTTKGNSGMGIGVYEARQFVHGAGGTLDVRSAPGRGTTVMLSLPLAASAERGPAQPVKEVSHG